MAKKRGSDLFFLKKANSYIVLSTKDFTSYQGLYFLDDNLEFFKFIESINYDKELINIEFSDNFVKRIFKDGFDEFYFKEDKLVFKSSFEKNKVTLDFRHVHDFDDKGRIYKLNKENNVLTVNYDKFEDNNLEKKNYSLTLKIKGDFSFEYSENWKKITYEYDLRRGTKAYLFLNDGLTLIGKSFEITSNFSIREDVNQGVYAPLDNLVFKQGIFAGLPWFYQYWARDELISIKPYILKNKKNFVKKILLRHLDRIDAEGLVKNRYPESMLGSIDASGWLFKRINECIDLNFFSKDELKLIYEKNFFCIQNIQSRVKNNLLYNKFKETWMDTSYNDGGREGFSVEIQFLYFEILKTNSLLSKKLEKQDVSKEKISLLKKAINEVLVQEDVLYDNFNNSLDKTMRPNVFLAYYINSDLVSKQVWEKTFDNVLNECWLEWGGLASISKKNSLFQETHTGMNNKSYHRGDSWFFVNNIAAISMLKLNKQKYYNYIKTIFDASTFEKNNLGFLGQCAEISNAKNLSSEGSFAQAWSASTLFELEEEIKKN